MHAAVTWSLPFLFALLYWASFHPLNLGFLGWVSLVPLLVYAKATSGKKAFFVAWLGGALAFGACFFWVRFTVPPAPYLLGIYKGLYVALFVVLIRRLGPLWTPVVWVALEYVRGYLFSGLPWFLLGYTQHDLLYPIQIADLGGVWLVSVLVAFVNGAIVDPRRAPKVAAAVAVVAAAVYGAIRLPSIPMTDGPRIAIVQPNIPQDLKNIMQRDPFEGQRLALESFDKHAALTKRAAETKPDLIVWPEAAIYYEGLLWNADRRDWVPEFWYRQITALSERTPAPLLIGALVAEGRGSKMSAFTNSAVTVDGGTIRERYDKVHLVPFAEYIPFTTVFPWFRDVVRAVSGVRLDNARAGEGFPVWNLGAHRYGTQICFEAIFPEISREIARNGASFTVNISNDGWFRTSGELDQMLAMARFRAIENRMHVVRATNTGISAFIEPTGRVQSLLEMDGKRKEVEGTLTAIVKVTGASSLFRAWGNWVAWMAVGAAAAGIGRIFFIDRKKRTA